MFSSSKLILLSVSLASAISSYMRSSIIEKSSSMFHSTSDAAEVYCVVVVDRAPPTFKQFLKLTLPADADLIAIVLNEWKIVQHLALKIFLFILSLTISIVFSSVSLPKHITNFQIATVFLKKSVFLVECFCGQYYHKCFFTEK